MKLGLLVEVEEGLTWERWRAIFGAAERLGFESVWLSDHLCSPWTADRHGLETWVALTVAAVETRRVKLGTLVSPVTFRQPALVARQAESVQALSAGRLTVGLGLGWNQAEHHAFGIPFPPVNERARVLEQTIALLKGVAPILIGGSGERWTLPIVARYADEWNLTTSRVAVYAARSEVLGRLCAQIGRDPWSIARSVAVGYLIGRDAADLARRRRRMQAWVPPIAGLDVQGVLDLGWVVGTASESVAHLRSLGEAGIERVMLGHYAQTDLDALELIATEVLPRVA
jgi:alkanesulfonate monooxygenase SsuD/methylene tetrahydromethanopterin reductase-like flavin-dependent oxidoreductase (luciferase family)